MDNQGVDMQPLQAPPPKENKGALAEKPQPAPQPEPKKAYVTFHEAWAAKENKELRRLTQQNGLPRLSLSGDDLMEAQKLISKVKKECEEALKKG